MLMVATWRTKGNQRRRDVKGSRRETADRLLMGKVSSSTATAITAATPLFYDSSFSLFYPPAHSLLGIRDKFSPVDQTLR